MTRFADEVLTSRQVLARGQVADAVTGAGIEDYAATLSCEVDGIPADLPLTFNHLPHGWFAAWLLPGTLPAQLAEAAQVKLAVLVHAPGYAPAQSSRSVPGGHFELLEVPLGLLAGSRVHRLAGDPLDFRFQLAPASVGLRGIVIYDNDPARPVAGASVSAAGVAAVTAGPGGRFDIPQLPLAELVEVTVSDGTDSQTHHVPVDFGRPVNVATLSLSQANVENDHG